MEPKYTWRKPSRTGNLDARCCATTATATWCITTVSYSPGHNVTQTLSLHCCLLCALRLPAFDPQQWGHEMKYKKVLQLPRLVIKNFALDTPGGRQTPKKWKNVNFIVEPFDFEEYCQENFEHLFD